MARELLDLAESGELSGLTFVAKLGVSDHAGIVGAYRDRPGEALMAALRMKMALLEDEDQ